ncbi:MAG TPA: UDP-N-acetylglucosamine 2-epimerase (non-hydrolyzing) [Nitrososphaera sp.]|jgi:UDP-N-acetylglucosamine 2-epimerase|nr:UDP-N-acetylglucosamine 2-epimerase (non-hydrolyzing) [Nitrososphaera sp.]
MQIEKNLQIVTIAGTRPEIIKLSELVQLLDGLDNHALLYTGQHYSDNMKSIFFDELNIKPDYDLRCDTSDVGKLKERMVEFLRQVRPPYVLVYGDTNSSLAGALAAKEVGSTLVHIEAGLRCFDLNVPEEKARIQIDSMSDYLFPPTELARTFLKYEQTEDNVFVTGNLVVDVCRRLSKIANERGRKDLPSDYLLLTMHRQENVDEPARLELLVKHLANIKHKIVFPIHPRTRNSLAKHGISLPPNVMAIEPAGYLEFLNLLKNCRLVMTDSGGVQEEAIVLKRPCITLRHVSERWETLLLKANVLFPLYRRDSLSDVVETMLATKIDRNPYGEDVAKMMLGLIKEIVA